MFKSLRPSFTKRERKKENNLLFPWASLWLWMFLTIFFHSNSLMFLVGFLPFSFYLVVLESASSPLSVDCCLGFGCLPESVQDEDTSSSSGAQPSVSLSVVMEGGDLCLCSLALHSCRAGSLLCCLCTWSLHPPLQDFCLPTLKKSVFPTGLSTCLVTLPSLSAWSVFIFHST